MSQRPEMRATTRTRLPRWLPETTQLLADVVHTLRTAEGHDYRSLFERVISHRAGVPYVRLCDDGGREGRGGSGGIPLSFPVPWQERPVVLLADSPIRAHLGRAETRQLLRAAAQVAVVVLRLEAAHAAKAPAVESGERHPDPDDQPLLGASPVMDELRYRVRRVAHTDFRVLIEGETGAGKEIVARQIHRLSTRHRGPFVAVNCAALVDTLMDAQLFGIEDRTATGVKAQRGLFEKADGGVLFLDEIGELPLQAQAKILRVLQEDCNERVGASGPRPIDVRVIAATNRDLPAMVRDKQFREDLYYRIGAAHVRVPPLREHPEDIVELARAHLDRQSPRDVVSRITSEAMEALMLYDWPGNVRQLERVLEQAVTEGDGEEIRLAHLPAIVRSPYRQIVQPLAVRDDSMRAWRSRYAQLVLRRCGDNKREACRTLKISYHTLRSYLGEGPSAVSEGRPSGHEGRSSLGAERASPREGRSYLREGKGRKEPGGRGSGS